MRLTLAAVGRLKGGPESDLAQDYHTRLSQTGRKLGWRGFEIIEIDESRDKQVQLRKRDEATRLIAACPTSAYRIMLDERGKVLDSKGLADKLRSCSERAVSECVFFIGGPDGLDDSMRDRADLTLSFGAMTWPHRLVRIMLLEQLYRAATILTGHPYHRG